MSEDTGQGEGLLKLDWMINSAEVKTAFVEKARLQDVTFLPQLVSSASGQGVQCEGQSTRRAGAKATLLQCQGQPEGGTLGSHL